MHEQLSTGYMQKSFHKNKVLNNVQIFRTYVSYPSLRFLGHSHSM